MGINKKIKKVPIKFGSLIQTAYICYVIKNDKI